MRTPPSWRDCFAFPLGSPEARRDVAVGGALLLLGPIGWLFNLGHRLDVVARLARDERPYFRGFTPLGHTFRRGATAAGAIALYLSPSIALGAAAWAATRAPAPRAALALAALAAVAFALAIYALPGGMTYNAVFDDLSWLYRPDRAFRRALAGGAAYLRAWAIALAAISLSLAGLIALGVGFLWTSVWAWSVVGYAFSKSLALSDPDLGRAPASSPDSAG